MADLYDDSTTAMIRILRVLEGRVQQPQLLQMHGGAMYRYRDQTIHQAIIMKLARLVSALQAARLLLSAGLLQDFGASQRVIDEVNEDVVFLCLAAVRNETTQWHKEFLAEFWQEEFDGPTALTSKQKRHRVPREKVRGYIANVEGAGLDQSTRVKVIESISKTYSGFVHGAGSHIMEMYFGDPPQFQTVSQQESPFLGDHTEDLQNCFLRALCSFGFAAAAFGDDPMKNAIKVFRMRFEEVCGMRFDNEELAEMTKRQRRPPSAGR